MKKILLDQPILDIKGKPLPDRQIPDAEGTLHKYKRSLREEVLDLLGAQLPQDVITSNKDNTWVWNLANQFNGKEKEIEVSDEKLEFLKKIVVRNAWIIQSRDETGQIVTKEVKKFTPFEVGQILQMLGDKE